MTSNDALRHSLREQLYESVRLKCMQQMPDLFTKLKTRNFYLTFVETKNVLTVFLYGHEPKLNLTDSF
jgi:hypothetical protein